MIADNLDTVADELQTTDTVEVSDELLYELDIWSEGHTTSVSCREPVLKSKRDNIPVSYRVYDISDAREYDHIALKIYDKQQGERYTVPLVIGLGEMELEEVHVPSVEEMQEDIDDVAAQYDVETETPARWTVSDLRTGMIETCKWFVSDEFQGNVYGMAFDGTDVYVTPQMSRWEGIEFVVEDSGVPDEHLWWLLEQAQDEWVHKVRGFDGSSRHPFKMSISFD